MIKLICNIIFYCWIYRKHDFVICQIASSYMNRYKRTSFYIMLENKVALLTTDVDKATRMKIVKALIEVYRLKKLYKKCLPPRPKYELHFYESVRLSEYIRTGKPDLPGYIR